MKPVTVFIIRFFIIALIVGGLYWFFSSYEPKHPYTALAYPIVTLIGVLLATCILIGKKPTDK